MSDAENVATPSGSGAEAFSHAPDLPEEHLPQAALAGPPCQVESNTPAMRAEAALTLGRGLSLLAPSMYTSWLGLPSFDLSWRSTTADPAVTSVPTAFEKVQQQPASSHSPGIEAASESRTPLHRATAPEDLRNVVLSLEMFETDVQPVLDAYLSGSVREKDLLQVCLFTT